MHAHDNPSPPPSPETRGMDVRPFFDKLGDPQQIPELAFDARPLPLRSTCESEIDPFSSPSPLSPLSDEQEVENLLSADEPKLADIAQLRVDERPTVDVALPESDLSTPRRSDRYRRTPTRVPVELTAGTQVKPASGSSPPRRKLSSPTRDNPTNEAISSQKTPLVRKQTEAEHGARRMLDSLSPSSSNLLSRLLPSFGDVSDQEPPRTPARNIPHFVSPSKLNAPAAEISIASPRRITVDEAVAQGQLSPQRAAQIKAKNTVTPSRTPVFTIPRDDSPARRVNVASGLYSHQKWSNGLRFGSPARRTHNERSHSVEPVFTSSSISNGKSKQRSGSAEPTNRLILSAQKHTLTKQLPFPILAKQPVPPPIPEDNEQVLTEATLVRSEKVKSVLKHPTSRIPRMQKPYTRPAASKLSPSVKKMVFVNIVCSIITLRKH